MPTSPDAAAFTLPLLGDDAPSYDRPGFAAPADADGGWAPPELPRTGEPPRPPVSRHAREVEEAYARGRAEGQREGADDANLQLVPALETLALVVEALEEGREQFARDRERNLHALAMAVARNLIQREVSSDPAVVSDLVGKALELLPAEAPVEVRLHPADLEAIGDALSAAAGDRPALAWVGDPAIERGGFLIDSPLRIVDGRTDIALRQLYERLEHD